jgi:hypothetical protein
MLPGVPVHLRARCHQRGGHDAVEMISFSRPWPASSDPPCTLETTDPSIKVLQQLVAPGRSRNPLCSPTFTLEPRSMAARRRQVSPTTKLRHYRFSASGDTGIISASQGVIPAGDFRGNVL